MVQTPIKTVSLQEFLQQPDTKPASEYINGEIVQKPMPKTNHSRIQTKLSARIDLALEEEETGIALTEQRCVFAGRTIVPDITVVPWADISIGQDGKMENDELFIAPPWMIEILSEGQSQTRVVEKILHALEHGTQMSWLIDPEAEYVFAYTSDSKTFLYKETEQALPTPNFAEKFDLTVGQLFAWLYR